MSDGQLPIRLLLAGIFLISGALKLTNWAAFHDTFSATELFPRRMNELIARVLPAIEMVLGVLLLTGWLPVVGGPLAVALLTGFVAGLGVHRLRGKKKLVCGCFADYERERFTSHLILRNVLLLAGALAVVLGGPSAQPGWRDWILAGATAAGAVLVWTMLSLSAEAVELVRRYRAAEEWR